MAIGSTKVVIGSQYGTPWATFWLHLGSIKAPLGRLGLKVVPGSLKVSLLSAFWDPLGAFLVDFSHILGAC